MQNWLHQRPRRNRQSASIRQMVQENWLSVNHFIYPLFVLDPKAERQEIASMPGIYRNRPDDIYAEIENSLQLGIHAFVLFPAFEDELKDKEATLSWKPNFYLKTIAGIKERFPEVTLITDVAMDPYSSDGHDGFVENGQILNDKTLQILAKMTLAQAEAGADMVGPSDMMDGRVGYLRETLDGAGFTQVGIMAYTAKYASAFYGPFRDALNSAPKFGDKKTYQMNPANAKEALREAMLDASEGADFLMVKPALCYLDIISLLEANVQLPIAAYNVSGEYAMLKAAALKGWIDHDRAMLEMLLSIKRAGANVILTYFAKEAAALIKDGKR